MNNNVALGYRTKTVGSDCVAFGALAGGYIGAEIFREEITRPTRRPRYQSEEERRTYEYPDIDWDNGFNVIEL